MKEVIVSHDELVGPWVAARVGGKWWPQRGKTIGLFDTETGLIGGCICEDFNGANLMMHVAGIEGKNWVTREFLRAAFSYVFEQLGCKRVTGIVEAGNLAARRFDEGLGFVLEATLKDAHPAGDLCVYVMRKEDCRWLTRNRGQQNGNWKERCTGDAGLYRGSNCHCQLG